MLNFYLNGQTYKLYNTITLSQLMNYFNYDNNFFILEYNSRIYNRKNWSKIKLLANDKIEIISIVGGG